MTDTPRLWDRRADETPKSYAAFLAYVASGPDDDPSVRPPVNTTSTPHQPGNLQRRGYDGQAREEGDTGAPVSSTIPIVWCNLE